MPSSVEFIDRAAFYFMGGTSPESQTKADGVIKGEKGSYVEEYVESLDNKNIMFEAIN